MSDSHAGELEFRPREPGALFPWVKRLSLAELAVFAGLLVVWLSPGLEEPTFWFGLAHGIGFILLCLLVWIAILRREAPFWLLAATLTPVGPVGSTIGIEVLERRHRRIAQAGGEGNGEGGAAGGRGSARPTPSPARR